jgi:hypothetical protein
VSCGKCSHPARLIGKLPQHGILRRLAKNKAKALSDVRRQLMADILNFTGCDPIGQKLEHSCHCFRGKENGSL